MTEATSPSTKGSGYVTNPGIPQILELQTSVRQLSLNDTGSSVKGVHRPNTVINTNMKKSKAAVADSWEDEDSSSESGPPTPTARESSTLVQGAEEEEPLDPPPTPISPQTGESPSRLSQQQQQAWPTPAYGNPGSMSSPHGAAGSPAREPPSRRPEKQTAVAGRMIAGALGVRAPKRTEEQRAYDRSVKEQEIRRRNREREEAAKAKEEDEKAKAAVWDD